MEIEFAIGVRPGLALEQEKRVQVSSDVRRFPLLLETAGDSTPKRDMAPPQAGSSVGQARGLPLPPRNIVLTLQEPCGIHKTQSYQVGSAAQPARASELSLEPLTRGVVKLTGQMTLNFVNWVR